MNVYFRIAAVVVLSLMTAFSFAEDAAFLVKINPEKIVLESGGAIFIISTRDDNQCLKINDSMGITPYYRKEKKDYVAKVKHIYLKGTALKESRLIVNEKDKKAVKLIFQREPNFQLELTLSIQRELPCLFVKSYLKNISDEPQNDMEFEWFVNHKFSEYIAQDLNRYKMPEQLRIDFTCGKIRKVNWGTLGTSRDENWIYLLPDGELRKGLGIISKEPTSFGIYSDKFVYWGEKQEALEEGEGIFYEFVLVPSSGFKGFAKIKDMVMKQ